MTQSRNTTKEETKKRKTEPIPKLNNAPSEEAMSPSSYVTVELRMSLAEKVKSRTTKTLPWHINMSLMSLWCDSVNNKNTDVIVRRYKVCNYERMSLWYHMYVVITTQRVIITQYIVCNDENTCHHETIFSEKKITQVSLWYLIYM